MSKDLGTTLRGYQTAFVWRMSPKEILYQGHDAITCVVEDEVSCVGEAMYLGVRHAILPACEEIEVEDEIPLAPADQRRHAGQARQPLFGGANEGKARVARREGDVLDET